MQEFYLHNKDVSIKTLGTPVPERADLVEHPKGKRLASSGDEGCHYKQGRGKTQHPLPRPEYLHLNRQQQYAQRYHQLLPVSRWVTP